MTHVFREIRAEAATSDGGSQTSGDSTALLGEPPRNVARGVTQAGSAVQPAIEPSAGTWWVSGSFFCSKSSVW